MHQLNMFLALSPGATKEKIGKMMDRLDEKGGTSEGHDREAELAKLVANRKNYNYFAQFDGGC